MASNVAFIAYMKWSKPMLFSVQNWNIITDEVIILLCNIAFAVMILVDMLESSKIVLGWCVISIIVISIIKNLSITIKFAIGGIK